MDNKNKSTGTRNGIVLCDLLTVAFVVLKLCGVIKWSWIWIFSPLWIPFAFFGFVALIVVLYAKAKR